MKKKHCHPGRLIQELEVGASLGEVFQRYAQAFFAGACYQAGAAASLGELPTAAFLQSPVVVSRYSLLVKLEADDVSDSHSQTLESRYSQMPNNNWG